jgi:hypothetical protein
VTEDYRDFPQFLQVSDGIVPQMMPQQLYYTSFSTIYCSLIALSFDAIQSEILKMSLTRVKIMKKINK